VEMIDSFEVLIVGAEADNTPLIYCLTLLFIWTWKCSVVWPG